MKRITWALCLAMIMAPILFTSCSEEADIFPKDELHTKGDGEQSGPIENGPPTGD